MDIFQVVFILHCIVYTEWYTRVYLKVSGLSR